MKKTRWMDFVGANNIIFILVLAILFALVIMLYNQVSYFFTPLVVILSNIIAPSIVALLLYYAFIPVIDFLEAHGVKRLHGVIILYLLIIGLFIVGIVSFYTLLTQQLNSFIDNLPGFIASLNKYFASWGASLPFSGIIGGLIKQGENLTKNISANIEQYLSEGYTGLSIVISGVSNLVVTVATAPIILFFY